MLNNENIYYFKITCTSLKIRAATQSIERFSPIPIKTPKAFFTEIQKKKPNILMEPQETVNSQRILEKEQNWRHHVPWFQTILQSYSN